MRRLFACLSALCLLGSLGCHKHVAGICDCDIPGHTCLPCCAWHHMAPGVSMPSNGRQGAEPIKEPAKEVKPEGAPEPAKEIKPDGMGSW